MSLKWYIIVEYGCGKGVKSFPYKTRSEYCKNHPNVLHEDHLSHWWQHSPETALGATRILLKGRRWVLPEYC